MVDDSEHFILVIDIELFKRADFFSNDGQYLFKVVDSQTLKYVFNNDDCQWLFYKGFLGIVMSVFLFNTHIAKKRYKFANFIKMTISLN